MMDPVTTPAKSPLLPEADYVRVEIRVGGIIHTYELEPHPNLPIQFTVNIDTEQREVPGGDGMSRRWEPGDRTANIQVSGMLARADRKATL